MKDNKSYGRGIKRVWNPEKNQNSSKHKNRFLLAPGNWEEYDPFLLLAEDWFKQGTFDVHPHRGIETVTYVIEGELNHFDNNGGEDKLLPGDAQWMTAGRGVIHKEDPAPGDTVHSLQLWINLPSESKLAEPRYQNLRSHEMSVREEDGGMIRVFSGSSKGVSAETKNYVPITMVEVILEAGKSIVQDLPGEYNGFIFVLEGTGIFGVDQTVGGEGQMLWLGEGQTGKESEIIIESTDRLRCLLYAGKPVREKVVARGPFVMNSEDEIRQAYKDYQDGKFDD